jgi:hypothetical protein
MTQQNKLSEVVKNNRYCNTTLVGRDSSFGISTRCRLDCPGIEMPISMAVRSKAWDYGRSPAEIAGSNPAGGMNVCVVCFK